ncbi:hypothetical protein chiPu_0001480 [Chiloscyllium punctatum]|uniref:Uncharacterized protein n=1 Tax=Chiloscyllium punctatum TaxID=137246 RepID=A0A401RY48_CHIPU|nr:hypothetical protein [Chiloscyllium punctatum]
MQPLPSLPGVLARLEQGRWRGGGGECWGVGNVNWDNTSSAKLRLEEEDEDNEDDEDEEDDDKVEDDGDEVEENDDEDEDEKDEKDDDADDTDDNNNTGAQVLVRGCGVACPSCDCIG